MAMNGAAQPQPLEYDILPMTEADIPAVIECNRRAFARDPLQAVLWKHADPEAVHEYRRAKFREYLRQPQGVYVKAVSKDDATRVVGYAGWLKPGCFQKREETPESTEVKGVSLPAGADVELYRNFMAATERQRKAYWGDNADFWYLGAFAVDPDYQRRGIATRLLSVGLQEADKSGLPVYLETSPAGEKFYPHHGFEFTPVTMLELDGGITNKAMVRQARK